MMIPVNPNATEKAKQLLSYLYRTAGNGIITGQHTQTNPMEEIAYIKDLTGKEPKSRGFELLAYSPNINYGNASEVCLTEVYENRGTMDTALKWPKENDGIVTLTFHWYSPMGGHDKSFYAENTDFDAKRVLEEGTPERTAFFHDLDHLLRVWNCPLSEGYPGDAYVDIISMDIYLEKYEATDYRAEY